MERIINAKTLRTELASLLERVQRGERFTVLYRSRPVCRIVPIEPGQLPQGRLEEDTLYRAGPLGRSTDGLSAADHDSILYPVKSPHNKRK
jgi:prevent-host-death family protein